MQIAVKVFIIITCAILQGNGTTELPPFDLLSTDFSRVITMPSFVDKTPLIKEILEGKPKVVITATDHFGKSTNLDMLKRFLEIQVDKHGKAIYPLNGTENYRLFAQNNLKIMSCTKIVEKHFGKFPVLYVNFKCDCVLNSLKDVLNFCKRVMHESYKRHSYLIDSEKLTEYERALVEIWCDEDSIQDLGEVDISVALKVLSELLCTHFDGKKSFALIDEYDSFTAHLNAGATDQDKILTFFLRMMRNLLKANPNLGRAVLAGTSCLAGMNEFVAHFGFLQDHVFFNYFGLTGDEVDDLFRKLGPDVSAAVKGCRSQSGKYIYNYYTVLRNLQFRVFQSQKLRVSKFLKKYCVVDDSINTF